MSDPKTEQACAFAAITQAAVLVHRTANAEPCHPRFLKTLIDGVFVTDPEHVGQVYGSVDNLLLGISSAASMLDKPDPSLVEPLKYTIEMIALEKRLRNNRHLVSKMGELIAQLKSSNEHMSDEEEHAELAEIYQRTVSQLGRRIQVSGNQEQLLKPHVAQQIRALLLSGVRFAWLWRQLGGRRWHLLTRRAQLKYSLSQLHQLKAIH